MSNCNECEIKRERDNNQCFTIVALRSLARAEAKQTGEPYEVVMERLRTELDDLNTFYAPG